MIHVSNNLLSSEFPFLFSRKGALYPLILFWQP